MGDVAPVEDDGSALGLGDPADGVEQRRLAGTVGAEQRHDLALVDLHVDAEEHLHVAVGHLDVADEQELGPTRRARSIAASDRAAADFQTCSMSPWMVTFVREMMSPPMKKSGTMMSMPLRMP